MTTYNRTLRRQFSPTHEPVFKNILVSGCSFTWNNGNEHIVTWPFYLRDLANIQDVEDCSQAGAGCEHIFNSIVYEVENNPNVNPASTLIMVMWSGLSRHDVIATRDVIGNFNGAQTYQFDETFSTFSIFARPIGNNPLADLCRDYWKIVDFNAQILASTIKIVTLKHFLESKGFKFVFLSWKPIQDEMSLIPSSALTQEAIGSIAPITSLDTYAGNTDQRIPDDEHPSPNGHLGWTREHLMPYLESQGFIKPI